jgi:hypothetical protein
VSQGFSLMRQFAIDACDESPLGHWHCLTLGVLGHARHVAANTLAHKHIRTGCGDLTNAELASDNGSFAVAIGEHHPFSRDAVDVGRLIAHESVRVAAQVPDADAPQMTTMLGLSGSWLPFGTQDSALWFREEALSDVLARIAH